MKNRVSDEEKISIIKQEQGWWVDGSSVTQPFVPVLYGVTHAVLSLVRSASSVAEKSAEVHARYVTCRPACLYAGRQIRKLSITQASACRGQSRQFQSTCVYTEHVKHIHLLTRGGSRTIVTSLPWNLLPPQWLA